MVKQIKTITSIFMIFILLFLGLGCKNKSEEKPPSNSSLPPNFNKLEKITLERGSMLGGYKLTIKPNGDVVLDITYGRYTKSKCGPPKISKSKIKELVIAFYSANYFSLKNSYNNATLTDGPFARTSISINGKKKTIIHNKYDRSAPASLTALEDKIDEIVDSERYVNKTPGEKKSDCG